MTDQVSIYDASTLAKTSADELLAKYSIPQLEGVKSRLGSDVAAKRAALRSLVGSKYRDLLQVADDIVSMDQLVRTENETLVDLAFSKSDYNTKRLQNLAKFKSGLGQRSIGEARDRNRIKVFRNLVHSCIYDYYHLGDEEDEVNDDYEYSKDSISTKFVRLAKQLYLVRKLFHDELEDPDRQGAFSIIKFKSIVDEFEAKIQDKLTRLAVGYEYEFALNLMTAYVIVTRKKPLDALKWFLEIRRRQLNTMDPTTAFKDTLSYIFVTLSYMSAFRTRLSTMLIRQIYSSVNSDWSQQTCLRRWAKWIDGPITVDFPLTAVQLKSNDDATLDTAISTWKRTVDDSVGAQFSQAFDKTLELKELSAYLNEIFDGFKSFSSLVNLQGQESPLLTELIELWRGHFFDIQHTTLQGFDKVSDSIMESANLDKLNGVCTNNGINMFQKSDISDIDLFINEVANLDLHNTVIESILEEIKQFKTKLRTILGSLESLKKMSTNLERPVSSIDDSEDPEFWENVSGNVDSLVNESAGSAVHKLNGTIEAFLQRVSESAGDDGDPVVLLYLVRILVQLKEKLDLTSIYSSLNRLTKEPLKMIDFDDKVSPLLTKLVQPVVDKQSAASKQQIADSIDTRLATESLDVPEMKTWEEYMDKKIPTSPSMDIESSLYEMSTSLLSLSGSEDYSDVYLIDNFEPIRAKLITDLIKMASKDCAKLSKDAALLTYADLVFLNCFNETEVEQETIDSLGEANEDLLDQGYRSALQKFVETHFKTVRLMYYPLSK